MVSSTTAARWPAQPTPALIFEPPQLAEIVPTAHYNDKPLAAAVWYAHPEPCRFGHPEPARSDCQRHSQRHSQPAAAHFLP